MAVLSLAVAIALNTTMYSVMDAMLDPRISARKPDHVYRIGYYGYGPGRRPLTPDVIEEALRAELPSLEDVTGAGWTRFSMQGMLVENGPRYQRLDFASTVWPNYFDFLGSTALEGRTFIDRDRDETVCVISDRLARKLFPDESPVGKTVLIDGNGFTVVGVVQRNATYSPLIADLWITQAARPVMANMIRLREKVGEHEVAELLRPVSARLALATDNDPGKWAFRADALKLRNATLSSFHFALIGAVAAVLLVACANLANLQLARGLARSRELALRSAIGASRRELISLLVLESALLAFLGLVLGVLLSLWGVSVVRATIPPAMEEWILEPQTSWKMFAFAAMAALLCLFLVGLVPAVRVSRVDPDTLLKSGMGTGANRANRKRYGAMVIAQIGLALPVLVGAVVAVNGSLRVHDRDYFIREVYGYDTSPLVAANVQVPITENQTALRLAGATAEAVGRALSVPNVVDATASISLQPVRRRVMVDDENGQLREVPANMWAYRVVSPSYFRVFGRAIERGRDFRDGEFDGRAAIIDAPTARFLWGSHDPIGRAIKFGNAGSDERWHTVVGVVGDMRDTFAIRRRIPDANYRLVGVYRVITPSDTFSLVRSFDRQMNPESRQIARRSRATIALHARVRGNTELAAVRLQRALRSEANEGTSAIPLEDEYGMSEARIRHDFVSSLFGTFALLGLGLVAIGVYGIVSHTVAERRRELAVRISLGASARDILRSVLREGNVLVLSGVAVGLLLTKYSVGWLDTFWATDTSGYDAPLFALIAAWLFGLAVFAAWVPAWRATRIDPVEALRHE